jgi:hypothetical protein
VFLTSAFDAKDEVKRLPPDEHPVADLAFAVLKLVAKACLALKSDSPIIDVRHIPCLRSMNLHMDL